MMSNCNQHSWFEFKHGKGRLEYVVEGDPYTFDYDNTYRICKSCLLSEYLYISLDEFRQTKHRWTTMSSSKEMAYPYGLKEKLNEVKTQLKRDSQISDILE